MSIIPQFQKKPLKLQERPKKMTKKMDKRNEQKIHKNISK